ncbi:hypothetical protein AC578_10791 [Pseudocercospora eumusae]|uniref:CBM1 domain-containing protein n=1 Tax=Pseudocercospora eumusae TaxID=321146 RepID=A0A139H3W8_9PEZI|nr:hypothetical protein AC578_10791 [Pseudocercospora eumusae]
MQLLALFIATLVASANAAIPIGIRAIDSAKCYCPSAGCYQGTCSTVWVCEQVVGTTTYI